MNLVKNQLGRRIGIKSLLGHWTGFLSKNQDTLKKVVKT